MSHKLACYLVKQGILTAEQVEQAQAALTDPMESPMASMIRMREIDDVGLARWLSTRFALPLVNLARDARLNMYRHRGFWACMDTQRDREQLTKLVESGNPPWLR